MKCVTLFGLDEKKKSKNIINDRDEYKIIINYEVLRWYALAHTHDTCMHPSTAFFLFNASCPLSNY